MKFETAMQIIIFFFLLFFSNFAFANNKDWNYKGENGPAHWYQLNPENALCFQGKFQSPIQIIFKDLILKSELPHLEFQYQQELLHLVNNGHFLSLVFQKDQFLILGKDHFQLKQIDFHFPSEHVVNKKYFDGELQFIHEKSSKEKYIVSIFLKRGQRNESFAAIIHNLKKMNSLDNKKNEDIFINPIDLVPKSGTYISYQGSFTSPPCTEGVTWFLLTKQLEVSKFHLQKIREIFFLNNRPVQSIGLREVTKKN